MSDGNDKAGDVRQMNMGKGGLVPMPERFGDMMEVAKLLAKSTFVPHDYKGNPGDVLAAIMMGGELGLKPMAALQNIAVINGRPSVWGDAMLAIVRAHPLCEDIQEEIEEAPGGEMIATCRVKRRGQSSVVRTFSVEDAKRAGLWGKKGPWQAYPKRMLQMRARSFALRDAFPDLLRGLGVVEEVMDITPVDVPGETVVEAVTDAKGVDGLKARLRAVESNPPVPVDVAATEAETAKTEPVEEASESGKEAEAVNETAQAPVPEEVTSAGFWIQKLHEAQSAGELFEIAKEASYSIDGPELEKVKAEYYELAESFKAA